MRQLDRRPMAVVCVLLALILSACGSGEDAQVRVETALTPQEAQPAPVSEPVQQPADETVSEQTSKESSALSAVITALDIYDTPAGERWSVYIEDLTTGDSAVACDEPMQSASLIKLFVAGAVQQERETLDARYGDCAALLLSMLSVSDNEACNTLVRRLGDGDAAAGMARVNAFAASLGCTDTRMGRLMLDFGATEDNYTSTKDCGRILRALYENEFTGADELLDALRQQQRLEKIPAGVPDGVQTASKTGELDDVENDAAIVWAEERPYILCVQAEQLQDTAAARARIVSVSQAVYQAFAAAE